MLFSIFINYLDAGVEGTTSRSDGQEALQRDLDRLELWSMTNGMELNMSKCWILHLGLNNAGHKYKLGEEPGRKASGVLVDRRLSMSQQRALAAKGPNCILGYMKHNIMRRSKEVITPMYLELVWPHLEYCVQFKKHVNVLECMRRRAAKLVKGLESMSYKEWLRALGLSSLEKRRLKGDLIPLCKFLRTRRWRGRC